jgi:hypothetical protein
MLICNTDQLLIFIEFSAITYHIATAHYKIRQI